jgi:endonuclease/exonuclease/phosphatase family metal-dependent hydrolase
MNVVVMSRVPLGVFSSYANITTPIIGQTNDEGNPASQVLTNNRMWTTDVLVNDDYTFSLTGLHLKAGGGDRNQGWRMGQINLLREHFESLTANDADKNMLVLGDLNTTPGSKEFKTLQGDSAPHFVDPLAGSNAYSHPSDSAYRRIDHILPNREMADELIENSTKVVRPLENEEMIRISDHLPLEARFVVGDK